MPNRSKGRDQTKRDPLALRLGLGGGLLTSSRKTCVLQKPKLALPMRPTVGKQRYKMLMPGWINVRGKE